MKLGIIATHPIQYHAPWFRQIASETNIHLKVFYLWNFGTTAQRDPGFGHRVQWDVPLLGGYESEFVPNTSTNPGTSRFRGLRNPELVDRIDAFRPDVVLMMAYNYGGLYKFLAEWRSRSPLILRGDSHRYLCKPTIREYARKQIVKFILNRFSAFLYVGQRNREYYEYHGIHADKLFYSPHAIDNNRYLAGNGNVRHEAREWRANLGIPPSHKLVLFAGKFEEKKIPLDLLNAFKRIDCSDAALLFVGAGALETIMRSAAADSTNVFFAPFQNQSAMPRTYAAADVFVLPSFGPRETWGLCINEAMCQGLPIIASDHVGCVPDLVTRENGLVFPAGKTARLAECLNLALGDDGLRHKWGRESIRIIRRHSYRQSTEGLCDALDHVSRLKPEESTLKQRNLRTTA